MTTDAEEVPRIRAQRVRDLIVELEGVLDEIEGQYGLNREGDNNKKRMQHSARMSQRLLYAAHLADLARAEIMNTYHRFKGLNPPSIEV